MSAIQIYESCWILNWIINDDNWSLTAPIFSRYVIVYMTKKWKLTWVERSVVFEGFYKIKITHSNVLSVLFMIRTGIYEKKDSSNHQAVILQYSMLMLIIQVVNHHDFITYKTQYLNIFNDQDRYQNIFEWKQFRYVQFESTPKCTRLIRILAPRSR